MYRCSSRQPVIAGKGDHITADPFARIDSQIGRACNRLPWSCEHKVMHWPDSACAIGDDNFPDTCRPTAGQQIFDVRNVPSACTCTRLSPGGANAVSYTH